MELHHKYLTRFAHVISGGTLFNWEEEAEYHEYDEARPFTLQYLNRDGEVLDEWDNLASCEIEGGLRDDFLFKKDSYSLYTFAYFKENNHIYPYSWDAESVVKQIVLKQGANIVDVLDFEHENEEAALYFDEEEEDEKES